MNSSHPLAFAFRKPLFDQCFRGRAFSDKVSYLSLKEVFQEETEKSEELTKPPIWLLTLGYGASGECLPRGCPHSWDLRGRLALWVVKAECFSTARALEAGRGKRQVVMFTRTAFFLLDI